MIDLLTATSDAFFVALSAAIGVGTATVGQHFKEDAKPPFVMLGSIDSENIGTKTEQLEQMTVEVIVAIRGASRAPLLALMHQVRETLDGEALSSTGATLHSIHYTASSAGEVANDGATYVGLVSFDLIAEAA